MSTNSSTFNNRIRQLILLAIIGLLGLYFTTTVRFPARFFWVLLRYTYYYGKAILTSPLKKKSKGWVATLFIIGSLIVIAVPIYFAVQLISTKAGTWLSNPVELMMDAKVVDQKIHQLTNFHILSDENMKALQQKQPLLYLSSSTAPPPIEQSSYYVFPTVLLLKNGRETEQFLNKFIPLKDENVLLLGNETKNMIKANAVGIPVLAVIQGLVAILGYWIFGVKDVILWGFITGFFSMVPIVGTAIVWVPLCLYLFSIDQTGNAIGLLIYAAVVITNIDYVARLTLLRKFMDIHPLVTVFGVIVGIGLFGFWGVIFGPLLISYCIILAKIYINEFVKSKAQQPQ